MSEELTEVQETTRATPRTLANTVLHLEGLDPENITTCPEHIAGDIIEREGKKFVLIPHLRWTENWEDGRTLKRQVPYTYRQYYAHSFEDSESGRRVIGPGWDSKFFLLDDEVAIELHDRTFSSDELDKLPANLPDTDCLFVSEIDSNRAAAYQEYLDKE